MMKRLFLSLLAGATFSVFAQTDKELVESTTQQATIKGHINFLASDELRGRETESPEIDIAAKYLATSFERYGVEPINGSYFQQVDLVSKSAPTSLTVSVGDWNYKETILLKGADGTWTGEAVFLAQGSEEDFEKYDVQGKVVVVSAGDTVSNDTRNWYGAASKKYELAQKYGAKALIELGSNTLPENWDRYANYLRREKTMIDEKSNLPHIWAVIGEGEKKKLKLKTGKSIDATYQISGINKTPIPSKNVVGMVEGSDPELKNEFVIYSAHYDHVGIGEPDSEGDSIYNGARDNAVGVVTVMSMAEHLTQYPTKRSALFILFTAEEKGLLGSKYYVQNPLIPLDQMVFCFNSDNGGYNDTSIATIVGLGRTTEESKIMEAAKTFGLKAIDDPAKEQGLFDRSDNVHFARAGVPAPTFSLGFTAFDEEIMKYYHKTADNPETLDYEYLLKFFRAYVLSGRLIGNGAETPFWLEGDKYYEAGKTLYQE